MAERKSTGNEPVRKSMCETCPFREGSPYAYLADELGRLAISDGNRICHSTGKNNAINKRTGKEPHVCRGSRDIQLVHFYDRGVIKEPTDEAWNEERVNCGLSATVVKDPN